MEVGRIKTVKKSSHWHKHGKHKSLLGYVRGQEREEQKRKQKRKPEMVDSVAKLFRRSK